MELYATYLTFSIFPFSVIFQFSYLLPFSTMPACQPKAVGQGMVIRVGSARKDIGKWKFNLALFVRKSAMRERDLTPPMKCEFLSPVDLFS